MPEPQKTTTSEQTSIAALAKEVKSTTDKVNAISEALTERVGELERRVESLLDALYGNGIRPTVDDSEER